MDMGPLRCLIWPLRLPISLDFLDFDRIFMILQGFSWFWVDFEGFPGWPLDMTPEIARFLDMGWLRLPISLDFLGFPWIWVDFDRIFMILQGFWWFWDDFACWFLDMACLRADMIRYAAFPGWSLDMTPEMPGFLDMTRSDGFEDPISWILMILDSRMLDFEGFGSFLIPVLRWFSCFPDAFETILLADCLYLPCPPADSGRFLDSWCFWDRFTGFYMIFLCLGPFRYCFSGYFK